MCQLVYSSPSFVRLKLQAPKKLPVPPGWTVISNIKTASYNVPLALMAAAFVTGALIPNKS